jgi:hypothetical protein
MQYDHWDAAETLTPPSERRENPPETRLLHFSLPNGTDAHPVAHEHLKASLKKDASSYHKT